MSVNMGTVNVRPWGGDLIDAAAKTYAMGRQFRQDREEQELKDQLKEADAQEVRTVDNADAVATIEGHQDQLVAEKQGALDAASRAYDSAKAQQAGEGLSDESLAKTGAGVTDAAKNLIAQHQERQAIAAGLPRAPKHYFGDKEVDKDFDAGLARAQAKDRILSARGLPAKFESEYANTMSLRKAMALQTSMERLGKEGETLAPDDYLGQYGHQRKIASAYALAGQQDKAKAVSDAANLRYGMVAANMLPTNPKAATDILNKMGANVSDVQFIPGADGRADTVKYKVGGVEQKPVEYWDFMAGQLLPYASTGEGLAYLKSREGSQDRLTAAMLKMIGDRDKVGRAGVSARSGGGSSGGKAEKAPDWFPGAEEVKKLVGEEKAAPIYEQIMALGQNNPDIFTPAAGKTALLSIARGLADGTIVPTPEFDEKTLTWHNKVPVAPGSNKRVSITGQFAHPDGIDPATAGVPANTRAEIESATVRKLAPGFLDPESFAETRSALEKRIVAEKAEIARADKILADKSKASSHAQVAALRRKAEEALVRDDRLMTLGTKYTPVGKPVKEQKPSGDTDRDLLFDDSRNSGGSLVGGNIYGTVPQ